MYLRCCRRFCEHFGRAPIETGAADVRAYLEHLRVFPEKSNPAVGKPISGASASFETPGPKGSETISLDGRYTFEFTKWDLQTKSLADVVPTADEPFVRKVGTAAGKFRVTVASPGQTAEIAGTFSNAAILYKLTDEQRKKAPAAPK